MTKMNRRDFLKALGATGAVRGFAATFKLRDLGNGFFEEVPIEEAVEAPQAFMFQQDLHIGLFNEETGQRIEIDGGGYQRMPWEDNVGYVTFPAASGSWGKVDGAWIFDNEGVLLAETSFGGLGKYICGGDTVSVDVDIEIS